MQQTYENNESFMCLQIKNITILKKHPENSFESRKFIR